jgi:VWFA-related protein
MQRFAVFVAFLALALPTLAQQQQQPQFEERLDVDVVLLDAIVTDPKGSQILGLTKDDFLVRENGVEQPLESVDYFTNLQLVNAREQNAPFKVERVREDRYFIFFFDKPDTPGLLFEQLALARRAAEKFVDEQMTIHDRVAIVGHDVRLKVYSDFTSDKRALKKAIDDAAKFSRGITTAPAGEGPSILRNLQGKAMMDRTGRVYEALDVLGDALRPIRARKNVILFSPGIADQDETVSNGMLTSRSRYYDAMIHSLNAANVSVYTVQIQRDVDMTPLFHQRLTDIAVETGGEYFRFNTSFERAVDRVHERNAGYYLLSYRSRHPRGERGFQKVDVTVRNNPELKVTARSGYAFGD